MSFWQRLRRALSHQVLRVEQPVLDELQDLAKQEQRPKEAVAADLLSMALVQRRVAQSSLQHWHTLSPREQEVTALVCLGYTNAQIAARLNVSASTVKSHVRSILHKFGLYRRSELQWALVDWDFSAWDRPAG